MAESKHQPLLPRCPVCQGPCFLRKLDVVERDLLAGEGIRPEPPRLDDFIRRDLAELGYTPESACYPPLLDTHTAAALPLSNAELQAMAHSYGRYCGMCAGPCKAGTTITVDLDLSAEAEALRERLEHLEAYVREELNREGIRA